MPEQVVHCKRVELMWTYLNCYSCKHIHSRKEKISCLLISVCKVYYTKQDYIECNVNEQVETGDERQAGTSARVYIVLHGGKGGTKTSGKIWLNNGKFERGKTDEFNVEVAQMLSPLSKIDIGHDNGGAGPGWFCQQVASYEY